jgi:hypothetical protein
VTYQPVVGDQIQLIGRPSTQVVVLAYDPDLNLMWLKPDNARPITAPVTDKWEKVVPHPDIPNVWHFITTTNISRGFATKANAVANMPADAIALLHVKADGSTQLEWLPAPTIPPAP